jgi:ketosteroid isomerase-like protein
MRTIAALLILTFATYPGQAQSQSEGESKVLALERLWGQAAQFRDLKALESLFDDSIAYVHIDGRLMNKAEVLSDTKAVSAVEIVVDASFARSYGNVVIATGILHLKGVENGKPYIRSGRYLDTWIPRGDGWLCVSSMTTPIKR